MEWTMTIEHRAKYDHWLIRIFRDGLFVLVLSADSEAAAGKKATDYLAEIKQCYAERLR